MRQNYYDIESLENIFSLANFDPDENRVDIYILDDDKLMESDPNFEENLKSAVYKSNINFTGEIFLHNLTTELGTRQMAKTFGISDAEKVNIKESESSFPDDFRIVCDTDPEYDSNIHPYIFSYNGYQYDSTMLAEYFYEAYSAFNNCVSAKDLASGNFSTNDNKRKFVGTSAKTMRMINDVIFSPDFKQNMPSILTKDLRNLKAPEDWTDPRWKIRKNMLMTGRHVDVQRLNEKMSKVALKRLLGLRGFQILESLLLSQTKVRINNVTELIDLIAYNVSDVVNLWELFQHKFYKGQFSLKHGLLSEYPELKYDKLKNEYKPDIRPEAVRKDRITIDSTSAQFAQKILCPYGHLDDMEVVSFNYPAQRVIDEAAKRGETIKQINVLEESLAFMKSHFKEGSEALSEFMRVYEFYKNIEGKNFNDSDNYQRKYPNGPKPQNLSEITKNDTCIKYYYASGKGSSCYINFSTGGIHGAEFNEKVFMRDLEAWQEQKDQLDYVKSIYPDPLNLRRAKIIDIPDVGVFEYKTFIKSGTTIKAMEATPPDERAAKFYKNYDDGRPKLFTRTKSGTLSLNKKYIYTSAGLCTHEDFKSYYPNLLRMLAAFYNEGLGEDRYGKIFQQKEDYGKLAKNKDLPAKERELYAIKQNGTKLVLNAASGAADTSGKYKSPIQMNNTIIAMRVIGQLFTWRIGQAQTLEGARVISSNTDGLYSILDFETNSKILDRESKIINVVIEPEEVYLISKDANNRLEMDPKSGKLISSNGGSLGCADDTDPTKALSHPAIIDWAMTEYLIIASLGHKGLSLEAPFDRKVGLNILKNADKAFPDIRHRLRMFQNVLASSEGKMSFVTAIRDGESTYKILQKFNRSFIVDKTVEGAVHIEKATAKVITDSMKKKRAKNPTERPIQHDADALFVLEGHGIRKSDIPKTHEAVMTKVSNLEPTWYNIIENRSLNHLPEEELKELESKLNLERYLDLVEADFIKNWKNEAV